MHGGRLPAAHAAQRNWLRQCAVCFADPPQKTLLLVIAGMLVRVMSAGKLTESSFHLAVVGLIGKTEHMESISPLRLRNSFKLGRCPPTSSYIIGGSRARVISRQPLSMRLLGSSLNRSKTLLRDGSLSPSHVAPSQPGDSGGFSSGGRSRKARIPQRLAPPSSLLKPQSGSGRRKRE